MGAIRLAVGALVIGTLMLLIAPCALSEQPAAQSSIAPLQAEAFTGMNMDVGIYLISIYDFDAGSGSYLADFYIWFTYSNHSIRDVPFELMNGQPAYPGAKAEISNDQNSSVQAVWYRVRANLFIVPELKDFPFERSQVQIVIEHPTNNSRQLQYHWNESNSGVNPEIFISGWTLEAPTYSVKDFNYSFNESFSRITFTVVLSRNDISSAVQYLLPPIVFAAVGGLGFLFSTSKDTYVAARLGLTTSMLIAAVLFHISVLAGLPPIGTLNVLDKIMLGVYMFLGGSSGMTLLGFVEVEYYNSPGKAKFFQKCGFVMVLVPTLITLAVLLLIA